MGTMEDRLSLSTDMSQEVDIQKKKRMVFYMRIRKDSINWLIEGKLVIILNSE